MGEPSLPVNHLLPSLPNDNLATLVKHQFPGSFISKDGDKYCLATVHGIGDTEREALENAIASYNDMARDGHSLRQMLDDVIDDLRGSGMSRLRHDSLMEILDICEQAVNGGVLTNTVPWIMVPSYTREIAALRTKVTNRLGIAGQDAAFREKLVQSGKATEADKRIPKTHTSGTLSLLSAFREKTNRVQTCDVERVVHCNKHQFDHKAGQFLDPDIVYIGHEIPGFFPQSKWANPYSIGWDGTRDEVLNSYETYLLASPKLLADLHEIDGKTLAGWDAPLVSHGDVMIRVREDQIFKRGAFRQ